MDGKAPTWNDDMVAKLNAKAIREFLRVWQEYKNHDTYISGESYGGIYVPTVFYEYVSQNIGFIQPTANLMLRST